MSLFSEKTQKKNLFLGIEECEELWAILNRIIIIFNERMNELWLTWLEFHLIVRNYVCRKLYAK